MIVIEKPKKEPAWTADVVCQGVRGVREGCGAALRIEEDDLFRVRVGRVGFERYVAQFQCPECGARTDYYEYPVPDVLLNYEDHPHFTERSSLAGYGCRL